MKRVLIGAALLIGVRAIAGHWVVSRLSVENFRPIVESQLSEALGLAVAVEGDLSIGLLPELQIHAASLKVANLPGRPSPYLLEVGRLELELQLWPLLLHRAVAIDALEFFEVELRIEPSSDGRHYSGVKLLLLAALFAWAFVFQYVEDER